MTPVSDAEPIAESFDVRVARLSARQHGVFGRSQVIALGATKGVIERRLRAQRWEVLASGVYRLVGVAPSWRQRLVVACLVWGDGTAISHRAAAALWRLAGFNAGVVEVTVARTTRRPGPWVVHRSALDPMDVTTVEGVRVTTPERTLVDLASVLPPQALEESVEGALRRGLASMPRLRWCLDRTARSGRPGVAALRAVLDAHAPAAPASQSTFETRLRRTMRRAGLPEPVAQHIVRVDGRAVARVDFAYPDARLAIEADGFQWHSGRTAFDHDRARRNQLTLLGWRVIHVTWHDLERRPEEVMDEIRMALRVPATTTVRAQ